MKQVVLKTVGNGFCAVAGVGFEVDVLHAVFHGVEGDTANPGDFLICEAFGGQLQGVVFSFCEFAFHLRYQ